MNRVSVISKCSGSGCLFLAVLVIIIIIISYIPSFTLVLAQPSPTNTTKLEKIPPLSNIVGLSIVQGIEVSGINIGDTDMSVTLKREPTTGSNASNMSLPVTVIGAKLPVNNLTQAIKCLPLSLHIANNSVQVISMAEASRNTGLPAFNAGPAVGTTGQAGSTTTDENASQTRQIFSLLQKAQLGAGSIVNSNWSSPQTISMGLVGQGNIVAPSTSSPINCVLATVVPFIGMTGLPTVPLK
jgi:hypothetical protein